MNEQSALTSPKELDCHLCEPWHLPNDLATLSDGHWVDACWEDLRRRWDQGKGPLLEELISRDSLDRLPLEAAVDLVYAEYVIRVLAGETPTPQEYVERFPKQGRSFLRQFSVDEAFRQSVESCDADASGPHSEPDSTSVLDGEPTFVPANHSKPIAGRGDIPERIGKYQIVERLDIGGQSDVFRALHPGLRKQVAIKLGRDNIRDDSETSTRLHAEARLLSELNHPNLVKVHDFDLYEGRPFIVMDFIQGRRLDQWLSDERPTTERVSAIFQKIAVALAAVHAKGILQLDIKPANIMIDEHGEPRLIDFGLARWSTAWNSRCDDVWGIQGTLAYMPPEQAQGDLGALNAQADVFGLGATLYRALVGREPYQHRNIAEIRKGQWDRSALEGCAAPGWLKNVVSRAMDPDPQCRFASMTEFANALVAPQVKRSGPLWIVAAVAACCVVAIALSGKLAPVAAPGEDGTTFPAASERPVVDPNPSIEAAVATIPQLKVTVWDALSRRFLPLDSAASPRTGDQVKIEVDAPLDTEVALVLWNSEGELTELGRLSADSRSRRFRYPVEEGTAVPLTGSPGTEVLLLVGTRRGSLDLQELKATPPFNQPWPALPQDSVIRATARLVATVQGSRGLGKPQAVDDPEEAVQARLEQLRTLAAGKWSVFEAIAFSHQDAPP